MKLHHLSLLLPVTVATLLVQAQTADEIIAKNIDAVGGKAKLEGIKTMYIESTIDISGNPAPSVTYLVNNVATRTEIEFQGQQIIQCLTRDGGWGINPFMGQTEPEPMPEEQVKAGQTQLDVSGGLLNYKEKGSTVTMERVDALPDANNNDQKVYVLKLTTATGNVIDYYIDAATYYVVQKVTQSTSGDGQKMELVTTLSDFRKTDYGNVIPFSTTVTSIAFNMSISYDKVEVNKEIDPAIFQMPKK